MEGKAGPTGLEALGDMSLGTHVCLFYERDSDLVETLALYFGAGLANQELCLWITPMSWEHAKETLKQAVSVAGVYIEEGSIEILSSQEWYFDGEVFDGERALQTYGAKLAQALAKGYERIRVLADEARLTRKHWKAFSDYEAKINGRFAGRPISIVCAYPIASLTAADVPDISRTHHFLAARHDRKWEVLQAPELTHIKTESRKGELENQVQERTASLAQMNQALQAEILDHRKSEEALQVSQARLQTAIDAANIGLWTLDMMTGQVASSGHHDELFGFAPGEFDGTLTSLDKRVHPDDLPELKRLVQHAHEEGGEYKHEYRVVWPDYSVHWIQGLGKFIDDEIGQPARMYGAVFDITERKRTEEALRKSERVLLEAESLGHTGSWEQDLLTGEIFNTEENLRLFFGDDRGKGIPFDDYAEAVYPDDREYVLQRRAQLLEGGPGDIEYRVVWPDGSVHVIFGRATVVRDESGQAVRVYGTNVDITERKRAEQALKDSETKLRQAQQLANLGYWERDLVADRMTWSEGTGRIFGIQPPDGGLSQANVQEFIHPDDRERQREALKAALQASQAYDVEFRVVRPDGDIRFVHVRDQVVRDQSGRAIRMFGAIQDITERKRTEEAAREGQELVRLVLATLPVGVMVGNRDDDIILVNDASKRIWGGVIVPGLERRTQSVAFWHDSGRRIGPTEWASARALSDGETTLNERIDIETFDGQPKTILNSAAPVRNAGGLIIGDVIVNEDISGRVRAEAAMQNQAARAETLARIAARLNRHLDLNAVVQAVCQEIVDTFKVSQAAMSLYDAPSDLLVYAGGINIPAELASAIEPTRRARFDALLQELGPIMVVPDIQAVPDAPNAEFNAHLDVRTVVTATMLRDGDLIGVVAFGINGHIREFNQDELSLLKAISDQAAQALANAQLLKAANEQQEQLRALSAKLVEAQEEERLAVARDLHDAVGQTLTGLIMQLGTAKSLLPKSAQSARSILDQSEALLQEIIQSARSIITSLRPQVLDDLGLIPALHQIGNEFQRTTDVQVEIRTTNLTQRLPARAELAIFRIVQEALTNVRRHSQAHHVRIELAQGSGQVILSIQDDGVGFQKRASRPRASGDVIVGEEYLIPPGHYGLIGIQERATQLGGRLQIKSAAGRGTTLRVELPV